VGGHLTPPRSPLQPAPRAAARQRRYREPGGHLTPTRNPLRPAPRAAARQSTCKTPSYPLTGPLGTVGPVERHPKLKREEKKKTLGRGGHLPQHRPSHAHVEAKDGADGVLGHSGNLRTRLYVCVCKRAPTNFPGERPTTISGGKTNSDFRWKDQRIFRWKGQQRFPGERPTTISGGTKAIE
jgi:hypothetical protein